MSELHVIFGTGALGKAAARELVRLGKTVRMINRSGEASRLPDGVEVIASDAFDSEKNTWNYRRIPYNISDVQTRMTRFSLPERHILRLSGGW